MAERDSRDGKIAVRSIGGLNQRPSPNALPMPEMATLHGMFPGRAGWMERLPGILRITKAGASIRNIVQLDDGTGNILVQTSEGDEIIYTLAEIFSRAGETSNLISGGGGGITEDLYDVAMIFYDQPQGTNGGVLNAALNTWGRLELTSNPTNEGGMVTNFDAGPNTFDLGIAATTITFRIEAYVTVCMTYTFLNYDILTCSIPIAGPAVVTRNAHGLAVGDAISFTTTGTMPSPLVAGTIYYVTAIGFGANSFHISATSGGADINTTTLGTGDIRIRPTSKFCTAAAAIYNETGTTVVGVFTPVAQGDQMVPLGGNPNFPQTKQGLMRCSTCFTITGVNRFSIQIAGSSISSTPWTAAATSRGTTHAVTTALGGGAVANRFASIKITREA